MQTGNNNGIERQIFDHIAKANRILVALPQNPNGDSIGSGLALRSFLLKQGKEPEVVCSTTDFSHFGFLPGLESVKREIQAFQSFVVSLRTSTVALDELSYEQHPDRVDIFLKPKDGKFTKDDVSFRTARFPYDLIVVLDTPSLDQLGELYEQNTDLFFETPVINIDHHPNNEQYGAINLADVTATSTAEILTGLVENFEADLIDSDMATNLLAGIIVETNSFQHIKTTPRAFLKASNLISWGGRQQDIIRELYKTKNVPMLKLWGRALARLREVDELGLAYSLVNLSDLAKTGTHAEDILQVMKELAGSLRERKMIMFLAEVASEEVLAYFYLHPNIKSQVVAGVLGGQMLNGNLVTFQSKGLDLGLVEKDALEKLLKIKDQFSV